MLVNWISELLIIGIVIYRICFFRIIVGYMRVKNNID